ncbi:UDP-3-O-(3-hydroxymyristoyl)glucosamine N-acyltransferase [Candidatus Cardinium hertigii]|uniref:UDP-3-O-acylglucosamine N-acyltransferase n=1 Tax=Candidatus Cardinium hertigii TaxID=247481 RepID=A0A3N2QCB4_9BACT|nr:UDP-3-O-(3-hydroxymyristoyl)glucosamine N-acyltransferase [Candidatus Cardinium hertigii]ROT47430.1 UDP-3-O-(3-hydroxymyristoyl)glucosamine N-acyltransferase [Candidatus Cardinium hertigii]
MQWTISELVERFDASLLGSANTVITHLCTLEEGKPGGIGFFSNSKYVTAFYQTNASAVFVPKDFKPATSIAAALLSVENPYECFAMLIEEVHQERMASKRGIEFPSYIGEGVTVGENIYRGAFSYIGDHVSIGKHVQIYSHVYVGDYVTIGDHTILYSGAKIAPYTVIGSRCIIHSGAVIGSAGFGFITNAAGTYKRIQAIGNVVLADEVEIGSNTTIDAATIDKTIIGKGTKIDNLVQVAHNVQIGKHTAIAAQVGISGSTKIGDYCKLGGQTGIAGHLHLGDYVTALGRAGITRSFKKGHITLSGTPAFESKKFLSCYARFKNLAQLLEKRNDREKSSK